MGHLFCETMIKIDITFIGVKLFPSSKNIITWVRLSIS
jgi:hypothetical protein